MQEVTGFDPEDDQTESGESAAEASILMQHLSELDPETQEVITLRYMNGLAVKEIGEILGLAPNTVSVRIHRAISELKKRMHL